MDMKNKEMIHIPGGKKQDSMRLHRTTHDGGQTKTYKLFITDHSLQWITETMESRMQIRGDYCTYI